MRVAGRIDLLIELYDKGFFCQCNVYEPAIDFITGEEYQSLQHTEKCIGRVKVRELMNFTESDKNE